MKRSALFVCLMLAAGLGVAISGCNGSTGPAPEGISNPPQPTATPPANLLYVDHNGTLYQYALPLTSSSKPRRTLTEWPGLGLPPAIAVGPYGDVAVASPKSIRIFHPPIVSLEPSHASLILKLTPAITEVGLSGADLVDMEYDPNDNLWLLNNLGAEITELRTPISKQSVAALSIIFGAPGSKTAGYTTLVQARFDVNAALYVYASASQRSRLFKLSFPYAKPPGSLGINLNQAVFVDSSQWLPTAPNQPSLLMGQYLGQLASPKPGSPPSPPVNVMGEFVQPLDPTQGLFPNQHAATIVGALAADPQRSRVYALTAQTGELDVYGIPMAKGAKPTLTLPCLGVPSDCGEKPEHLFLAP